MNNHLQLNISVYGNSVRNIVSSLPTFQVRLYVSNINHVFIGNAFYIQAIIYSYARHFFNFAFKPKPSPFVFVRVFENN